MPAQWVASCSHWAAGEKNVTSPLQAGVLSEFVEIPPTSWAVLALVLALMVQSYKARFFVFRLVISLSFFLSFRRSRSGCPRRVFFWCEGMLPFCLPFFVTVKIVHAKARASSCCVFCVLSRAPARGLCEFFRFAPCLGRVISSHPRDTRCAVCPQPHFLLRRRLRRRRRRGRGCSQALAWHTRLCLLVAFGYLMPAALYAVVRKLDAIRTDCVDRALFEVRINDVPQNDLAA